MITVHEALSKMTAENQASFVALEAKIDQQLRNFDGSTILVECAGYKRKVLDHAIDAYATGGWHVEIIHGDQRDPGSWLQFRAKR